MSYWEILDLLEKESKQLQSKDIAKTLNKTTRVVRRVLEKLEKDGILDKAKLEKNTYSYKIHIKK